MKSKKTTSPIGGKPLGSTEPVKTDTLTLEERVIEALRSIYDPEIPVNIYDLGLIYSIEISDENTQSASIQIKMTLTSPGCPVAETFPQMVQDRILSVNGVGAVTVELVWDPPWTKDLMSEATKLQLNML